MTHAGTTPLIEVRDLERTFDVRRRVEGRRRRVRETVRAVHDLDLVVERGEMVGYIGPNGAGKSTTIKMLTGILVPTGGHLRVAGLHRERQVLHRPHLPAGTPARGALRAHGEGALQVLDLDQRHVSSRWRCSGGPRCATPGR